MIAIFLTTVRVRAGPSTTTEIVAKYCKGDTVKYDSLVENEGRLWISYIGRSGNRWYYCARDNTGEWYINIKESEKCDSLYQKSSRHSAVRNWGCCFLCACYLGGLNNINEADDCFDWASNCGKVRKSDSYVNAEKYSLAKEISQRYGRNYRNYKIVKGNNHFYVVDWNGNEVFNSMGFGWGH